MRRPSQPGYVKQSTPVPMVTALLLCLAISVAGDVAAQEFWAMPDRFHYNPGDTMKVTFHLGENFAGPPYALKRSKIRKVVLFTPGGEVDLTDRLKEGSGTHLAVVLPATGRYALSVETNSAYAEINAAAFNKFLETYAQDEVQREREKRGDTDAPGREKYARHTWFVVSAGEASATPVKQPSWPLLIRSGADPLRIPSGALVEFKVLFRGKPLFGSRAFVWNNSQNKTYMQPVYTQQDGTLEVRVFNGGAWMVSAVKMIPSTDGKADWESLWSSFVFHVPASTKE